MDTLYLLCELGDEHYTEPVFTVFQCLKAAFSTAIKSCLNHAKDRDFTMEVESQKRISVRFGSSNFYVTEVKETQEQIQCELEWETGVQACVDTGNEWELWTIINCANG